MAGSNVVRTGMLGLTLVGLTDKLAHARRIKIDDGIEIDGIHENV